MVSQRVLCLADSEAPTEELRNAAFILTGTLVSQSLRWEDQGEKVYPQISLCKLGSAVCASKELDAWNS